MRLLSSRTRANEVAKDNMEIMLLRTRITTNEVAKHMNKGI